MGWTKNSVATRAITEPLGAVGAWTFTSRDDVHPALQLQRIILAKVSEGFRPVVPIARGASPAVSDKPVSIPPVPFAQEIRCDNVDPTPVMLRTMWILTPMHPSEKALWTLMSQLLSNPRQWWQILLTVSFLLNTVSFVAHFACECDQSDPHRVCTFEWQGKMKSFKYACSARRTVGEVSITPSESIPTSYRICLRAACSKIFD